jgi:hypothetical protein
MSVVLPLPKKPVSMVTGTMLSCAANSISWRLARDRPVLSVSGGKIACRCPGKKGALQHARDYSASLLPLRGNTP